MTYQNANARIYKNIRTLWSTTVRPTNCASYSSLHNCLLSLKCGGLQTELTVPLRRQPRINASLLHDDVQAVLSAPTPVTEATT